MKLRRILALLMALCMLIGMMLMVGVSAEEYPTIVVDAEQTVRISESGEIPFISITGYNTVTIDEGGEMAYFRYTPEYTDIYAFYAFSDFDTRGYIYDSEMHLLGSNDDGFENDYDFQMEYLLEAGKTYILGVDFYSQNQTGSFQVALFPAHECDEDDIIVIKEATCTEDGESKYICENCGREITVITVAPGHEWPWNNVCNRCGETLYAEGTCGENLTWVLDQTGTLTISGYGPMYEYAYTSDVPWSMDRSAISSVVIENGVTSIGAYAFFDCDSLICIHLPDSITSIGRFAFYHSGRLHDLVIPASVTSISDYAFANCSWFGAIIFEGDAPQMGEQVLGGVTADAFYPRGNATWNSDVMQNCGGNITWNDGEFYKEGTCDDGLHWSLDHNGTLTISGDGDMTNEYFAVITPWYKYEHLCPPEKVVIDQGVTSIGNNAFEFHGFHNSLKRLEIADTVTSIGQYAFLGCKDLETIIFAGDAPAFGEGIFSDVTATAYYPVNNTTWTENVMQNYGGTITWVACDSELGVDIPTCSLEELTKLDYIAFSSLAYSSFNTTSKNTTIKEFLKNEWESNWKDDIKYKEVYAHIANWKLYDYFENVHTGYYAVAFTNGSEIVIAYRGSQNILDAINAFARNDPTDDAFQDWFKNDFPMILGDEIGDQIYDALTTYDDIAKDFACSNIATTGHSLGGALGDIISAYSGCKGVTVNAVPALDAAYRTAVYRMAPMFRGTDKWNFVDLVNWVDLIAGMWEEVVFAPIKPYISHVCDIGGIVKNHSVESLVKRNSYGNVAVNPVGVAFTPAKTTSNYMNIANEYIDLGISSNETIDAGLFEAASRTSYGGDGFDVITTSNQADTIVGGRHDDELDGRRGDDTYVYFKGDGVDEITDAAGNDTLQLYGFSENDEIQVIDDEAAGYIYVECNGNAIVKIKNNNRSQKKNSFKITGPGIGTHDITSCFDTVNFGAHILVACPVDVQVLDADGNVVYTIKDGESGNHYTEYGNFYVYEEATGGYGKVLDLIEGYSIKIVGVDTGTMDITYQSIEDGELGEVKTLSDIPVDDSFEAGLEVSEEGELQLQALCILGDVNSDGKVNTQDRTILARYLAKWSDYPESIINMKAADVNCDGKVNTQDRTILARHLAKWTGYETLGA